MWLAFVYIPPRGRQRIVKDPVPDAHWLLIYCRTGLPQPERHDIPIVRTVVLGP